ncbi:MAG: YhcH/YjgK/YiaL family protein [Polyangia bacterium]|jgi:YhcH/YjgK/YiaL family protein
MIFDVLANADRYASVHPLFAECFAFLRNTDLAALPVGRQPLGSSGCTVIVGASAPKTKQSVRLEGHRAFIDIQVMVAGEELIGYVPRVLCTEKSNDLANDFQELQGTPEYLTLRPGCFAIYFPEDGHHPGIATGAYTGLIRKIVIKVPVER